MFVIENESAFRIFYYMMAADGDVDPKEITKLDEIGYDLFGQDYQDQREHLLSLCQKKISHLSSDPNESYDILSEDIDKELEYRINDPEKGVASRLLIWNLLLMAYSDGSFDTQERRLLRHIGRKTNLGDSVLFEMEQYILAAEQVEKELENQQKSMEPYALVRPVVDELETRLFTIREAVEALINDELFVQAEKITVQDDFIDKAQDYVKEKANPMMKKVNDQAGKFFNTVKGAAAPAATETGKKLGKAFVGLGSKLMKQGSDDSDKEQE